MFKNKKSHGLVLLMVILLAIPALPGCSSKSVEAASYSVSLDVNPSIELTVIDNLVTDVKAFNDDGTEILFQTDVVGTAATNAVSEIVLEMVNAGYITKSEIDPYLLITVSNNAGLDQTVSEDISASLQSAAEETLNQFELDCQVASTLAAGDARAASEALGISVGRYMLFSFIAKDESMTIEEVMATYGHLTIGELMEMFELIEAKITNDVSASESSDNSGISSEVSSSTSENSEISTTEQKATLKLALSEYKTAKKSAITAFHISYQTIKDSFKEVLKAIPKKGVAAEINAQRSALKEKMLTDRRAAILVKKDSFITARESFLQAVSDSGLTEDDLDELMEEETADLEDPEENLELDLEIEGLVSESDVDEDAGDIESDTESDDEDNKVEVDIKAGINSDGSITAGVAATASTGKGNKK